MRDTNELPSAGPFIFAIVAEVIVVISVFAGAAWIITGMPMP